MGILSLLALFISLLTMLVLKDKIKFSLFSLLVIVCVILDQAMGIERSIVAILPLVLMSVSYLVCNRSSIPFVCGFSWIKSITVTAGAVIVIYTHKSLMLIIGEAIKNNYKRDYDPSLFYLLPFVVIIGVIIVNEVAYGPDYSE
jgi:hypothetical protein